MCEPCRRKSVQGIPLNCEDCDEELLRQRDDSRPIEADMETVTSAVDRSGTRLSEGVREFFETRFGRSFEDVRIHTGETADRAARAVRARAFTLGNHVVFRSGEYQRNTRGGQRLLAHELTHVIQAGRAREADSAARTPMDAPSTKEADTAALTVQPREVSVRRPIGASAVAREESVDEDDRERAGEPNEKPERDDDVIREAGYTVGSPRGVIHIAWTLDDGPTQYTEAMDEVLGGRPSTWFIQRNLLREGAIDRLKERQEAGDEIAIHSIHQNVDHVCWFPTSNGCNKGYETTEAAMEDLSEFVRNLRGHGLDVSFVRLPTGLHTQLIYYLRDLGADNPGREAGKIVDAQNQSIATSELSDVAQRVHTELQVILGTLEDHNLRLWGGAQADDVPRISWEAEASGVPRREDNIHTKFNNAVDLIKEGRRTSISFVVLAHDTTSEDVTRVGEHIERMETLASKERVLVRYYRMSELFEEIRGVTP